MIEARRRRTAALAVTALVIGLIIGAPGATAAVSAVASVAFAPGLDRSAMPFASAASAAPAKPGTLVVLTPARVFDGRKDGVAVPHGTVAVPVLGRAGVPSTGVAAIALTLTVTGQTSSGYVTAYAAGTTRPATSNVDFVPGPGVANNVVVPVGSGGAVDLYNGSGGSTAFIVDVTGFYRAGAATIAGAFTAVAPTRRLDTRTGVGGAPPGAGGVVRVNVGIADATVLMNLTVTGSTASGYVTAYPDGPARPLTSNINFSEGQTVANQILVAVGPNGVVDLYNASAGVTQFVLDVVGRYRAGTPTDPGALQPVTPQRQLDTRTESSGPIGPRAGTVDPVGGTAGVPASGVSALLLDVTVVTPARSGYLRVQSTGGTDTVSPPTSSITFAAGHTAAGLVVVAAGTGGNIGLYLGSDGPANVVVDVLGYTLDGPGVSRGTISGTVSVLTGSADGVTVRAYNGTDIETSTLTATDGTYTLPGVPARAAGYDICVVAPNDSVAGQCWDGVEWDGTTPAPEGTPVPVEGGTLRAGVDVNLREPLPTGVITGRLTAAHTGAPVAGARVTTDGPGGSDYVRATTGNDGTYQISDLAPGSYRVCFTPDNTATGTPPTGYANACHAPDVTVTDGHTTAGVNGALPIGAALSGRVTASADAAAITNVQLQVRDTSGTEIGFADTAADGTFRVVGLTGGVTVTVCFDGHFATGGPSVAGYLDDCYHTGTGTSPTRLTVTAGSTVTGINATLASAGGISGTVTAASVGVPNIDVLVSTVDGTYGTETNTQTDGTYAITGIPPGTYMVCFDASEAGGSYHDQCYHAVVWDGGALPPGVNPFSVTAGAVTEHIDASLTS